MLVGSAVYLPRALSSAAASFGPLGIAFTYVSWLFAMAFLLITTTVLGAAVARDGGPGRPVGARGLGHR